MKNDDSPCKFCTSETGRTPTCHGDGTCKHGYNEWKIRNDTEREENRQKRIKEATFRGYKVATANRNKKRRSHGDGRK